MTNPEALTLRELLVDLLDYSDGHGGRPLREADEQRFVIDTWSLTERGQQYHATLDAERTARQPATPDPDHIGIAYENGFRDGSNQAAQRIGGAVARLASPHVPESQP